MIIAACEGDGRLDCTIVYAASVHGRPWYIWSFMLTHGKEVRRVSFLKPALRALRSEGLPGVIKVRFWLGIGNYLTFSDVR